MKPPMNKPATASRPDPRRINESDHLGVPCVSDRVAQTVVARRLEQKVEAIFHPDSYGYRPGRAPTDAVEVCRQRCWKRGWVIDLDIQKFFDTVRWDLIVKAVQANTDLPWVVLYVKRWLQAPVQRADGTMLMRDRGTAQGALCAAAYNAPYVRYSNNPPYRPVVRSLVVASQRSCHRPSRAGERRIQHRPPCAWRKAPGSGSSSARGRAEGVWFAGECGERAGDLVEAGADVGGGGAGLVPGVGVSGVGAGDGVAEVAFDPGQGGVT
jgi:hypothetical protein